MDGFQAFNLREIQRQRGDTSWLGHLNAIRTGCNVTKVGFAIAALRTRMAVEVGGTVRLEVCVQGYVFAPCVFEGMCAHSACSSVCVRTMCV